MRQTLRSMARGALAAACILLSPAFTNEVQAQTVITVGDPSSTTYDYKIPINNLYNYSYTQQIFLSSDIGMSGDISKIRFKYNTGSLADNNDWTVYLGYKSSGSFSSNTDWVPLTNLTSVYSGIVTASGGWIEITLSTPFNYNMSSGNLVIAVDENSPSYSYESSMFPTNSSGSSYRAIHYRSDGTNPDPASPPAASDRLQYFNTVQFEITGPPCAGVPVAGLTSSNAGPLCAGVPFTLSATPMGLGGITYQFQSSVDDGTSWSNLGGVSTYATHLVASQSVATQYRVIVTCTTGGNSDTSSVISIGQNSIADCYCTPSTGSGGSTYYITNFTTTGGATNISNTSGGSATGYTDFHTTMSASALPTTTIGFSMDVSSGTFGRAIWIDYNEDGLFQPSEKVAGSTGYVGSAWTGSFTVPASTTPGTKRMRILAAYNISTPSDPCLASGSSGEFEDYNFEVLPLPLCTGVPAPGATYASNTTLCAGTPISMGVVNHPLVSGLSYQWYASTDGGTTWASITGATDSTYTVTPTANTLYRALATCSGSGDTASSTPVTIGFYNNITSVTPAAICGPGSMTLQAEAASDLTIHWYDAASGGTELATGSSFITPSLSTTTTYYAQPVSSGAATVTIGAGAMTSVSGNPDYSSQSPFTYHYGNYKHQMMVLASELTAAGIIPGTITSVAFVVTNPASGSTYATFNNFTVSLKQTTATAMTSTFETGTSVVWTGNYTPVTGTNTFTFTAPFAWDGTSNIIIQTCYNNNNSGDVDKSAEVQCDNTSFVSHTAYRKDGTYPNVCSEPMGNSNSDGPTISNRPKMIFGSTGSCAGPRVPVTATVGTPVSVDLGPDTSICSGDLLTLDAGNPGAAYAWSTGATTQTIDADAAGTYSVTVSSGACSASDTLVIDEIAAPVAGPIVIIDNMPSYDFSAPATTGGLTYSWDFGDGTTATTETASHTYTANGAYTVTFTVTNECGQSGSTTASVTVSGVGVGSIAGQPGSVQVYPNPSRGLTVVEAQGAVISSVEVMDNLGRMVLRSQPDAAKAVIDVKGMAQGIYTLRIQTNKGISTVKLVVKD